MVLRLTGFIISVDWRQSTQVAAPWGSYCAAEAARVLGIKRGRLVRRMRSSGMVNARKGVRGVRITPDDLRSLGFGL